MFENKINIPQTVDVSFIYYVPDTFSALFVVKIDYTEMCEMSLYMIFFKILRGGGEGGEGTAPHNPSHIS